MVRYTITGTVPQPMSNGHPPFAVYPPREYTPKPKPVGSKGRKVSVVTHSIPVGKEIVKAFQAVFENVSVKKEEIDGP